MFVPDKTGLLSIRLFFWIICFWFSICTETAMLSARSAALPYDTNPTSLLTSSSSSSWLSPKNRSWASKYELNFCLHLLPPCIHTLIISHVFVFKSEKCSSSQTWHTPTQLCHINILRHHLHRLNPKIRSNPVSSSYYFHVAQCTNCYRKVKYF